MIFLYNISIRTYGVIIAIASLFNKKAKLWIKGRKNWQYKLTTALNDKQNIYWFHCASLGEFEQGKPLMEKLKQKDNSITVLVTFFSPSGYELKKNYELADYVCYLPIDSKKNANQFISSLNITKAFFIKYEFWYHYFNQLKKQNIPFYMVSSSFRKNQVFFKSYGKWFKNILKLPTHIFVQDNESKKLLEKHNIKSTVTGDTRYDKVLENAKKAIPVPLIEQFKNNDFLIVAGSSWQNEEEIIAKVINNNTKLIIAPHNIAKNHIDSICKLFPTAVTFSNYNITKKANNILIIDNIGMLSNLYQYADLAIIGGGFTGALHNILEPATFGVPVLFGSIHSKFREAQEMINHGAAHTFKDKTTLAELINKYKLNNNYLISQKQKNKQFINDRIGATNEIINLLDNKK